MIFLYPEQLKEKLNKLLYLNYFLFGSSPFLIQESLNFLVSLAKKQNFLEKYSFLLNSNTNWNLLFNLCEKFNFFFNRRILILTFSDDKKKLLTIEQNLIKLLSLSHNDLLLIFCKKKLIQEEKNSLWFKKIQYKSVYILCNTPKDKNLVYWIMKKSKEMDLVINSHICSLLMHYYKGNLSEIFLFLKSISFLFPKKKLVLSKLKPMIYRSINFTISHWIYSILLGKVKRAICILEKFKLDKIEPILLLRSIQKPILTSFIIKNKIDILPMSSLYYQYKIKKNKYLLFNNFINRLTNSKINNIVSLMTKIELKLKTGKSNLIWFDFYLLTLLLCDKKINDTN